MPWTRPEGWLYGVTRNTWIAISVNGVIAGISQAAQAPGAVIFWGELPPSLFRRGVNNERLWTVTGPPEHPRLAEIPIGA